jgi:cofilin
MVDANLQVHDDCLAAFSRLKMEKDLRYVIFKVHDQRTVVVDRVGGLDSSFDQFRQEVPLHEPRFIVMDVELTNNDGLKLNKIIFIHWSPDAARGADKMVYASTKEALKRRFVGIFKDLQANVPEDLEYRSIVAGVRL